MAIANSYKYMKNTGGVPRFNEEFAFKHILNADDSDPEFLTARLPLKEGGERVSVCQPNTDRAYAQAMNRFNTHGVTAAVDTIMEPTSAEPRPRWIESKSGSRTYHLDVVRGWKFERIENNFRAPNHTKYEAVLRAQFSSERVANMSCMAKQGVVDHWDQAQNNVWFGGGG